MKIKNAPVMSKEAKELVIKSKHRPTKELATDFVVLFKDKLNDDPEEVMCDVVWVYHAQVADHAKNDWERIKKIVIADFKFQNGFDANCKTVEIVEVAPIDWDALRK